ncbi:kinesin-like protein KIF20B isoform X2 [Physella acuta]|uniref:kinesin-like protein KIF20B isoform X2 n=1 Tax=Physella acuta TaxID=109671 RepID=UPI0027DCE586|nr:kinesin-like protein KIF20B isoform X2 [Physella acuta]
MDTSGSICGKRSFSELQSTGHRRLLEEDELPVKKKLKTRLVDLFNRASICMASGAEDHMKVYLRIKPLCKNEDGNQQCFEVVETENTIVATAPEISHTYKSMKRGVGKSSHKFTFSRIFNEATTQGAFFNETMLDMTKDFISGQNSLVFTYGVTSSGKTYTIQGKPQDAGILPRCLDVIFNSINGKQIPSLTLKPQMFTDVVRLSAEEVLVEKRIKEKTMRMSVDDDTTVMTLLGDEMESVLSDNATASTSGCAEDLLNEVKDRAREELKVDVEDQGKIRFGVWVSFAEIYNEQIFDLLEPMPIKKNARRPVLKICDDRNGNPYVKGLKEIHVETADEAYKLLTIGQRNLQTACTRLNHCSSRSHCIFNIKIVRVADKDDPHIARVSMLSLCDLAGSERYSKTQATGDRLKEAGNINSSLMTLGRCIETLRHNQLHKDQQRLVPFRDSKLTRLLQNFFNGSGRAAMIVNVSQCATMFDDTLHVFKFSAIAKQVKYIEKPPEKPKKTLPPRESIQWETQEAALRAAQNDPLPEDDDEEDELNDEEEESSENFKNMKEIRGYIKNLERRNEKLVEMLEEEMNAASSIENRVRKEVTQAMMKQVVNIEETYSAMLKETREEGQELADERVKGIMEVYEQRLQRIQKKVDEDDEWVSSLLYHQEQVKVQERDLQIAELKNLVAQLKSQVESKKSSADDSVDIGNSAVIETLTQKLQSVSNLSKEKDAKIDELESLLTEAGEVYNKHMVDIKELKETISQQNKKLENQLTSVAELNKKLADITEQKDSEMKALEEDTTKKLKCKDKTISALEEECKELHDEIERLQDQMSQLDEQSRYRNEFETSSVPEKLNNSSKSVDKMVTSINKALDATYVETDSKNTSMEVSPAFNHSIGKESLDLAKGEDSMIISLQIQNEQLQADISELKVKLNQSLVEIAEANEMIKNFKNDNEEINEKYKISEMSVKSLQEENKALSEKVNSLHQANEELLVKVKQPTNSFSVSITEMVRKIENNLSASEHHAGAEEEPEDLNIKNSNANTEDPSDDKIEDEKFQATQNLVLKLKDAELANAALRSKLKREENDYLKREEALIHGYSAEIDNLKYELAKFKSKVDVPLRTRAQRGKKRALMDVSTCSVTSESINEGPDIPHEQDESKDKESLVVLTNEIVELQTQLYSLHAAYRKQCKNGNETNSFIQDVVLGTPRTRVSALGGFRSEDNVTDSVLQFEIEEYAIKMDELRTKIYQYDTEVRSLKLALEKERAASMNLEKMLKLSENKQKDDTSVVICEKETNSESAMEERDSKIAEQYEVIKQLQVSLEENTTSKKETEQELIQLIEKQKLQEENLLSLEKDKSDLHKKIAELVTEQDSLQQSYEKNMEMQKQNHESQIKVLNDNLVQITNHRDELVVQMNETKTELKTLKDELSISHSTGNDVEKLKNEISELLKTDQVLKDKLSEMSVYKEQFSNMEQAYKETKEKLQVLEELKVKLETELAGLKVTLSTKEDNLKNVYEEYNKKLESLQAEFTSEEDVKTETIAVLKKQLEDVKQELDLKKKEYEKLECQRQEDGAEVSQKLLVLEREKKAAERRAIEAKEREEEWQMKCQGLEKIKQEVSMQKRVDDLQQEINAEKEEKKRLEKDFLEQTAQLDLIKSSFKEAEEMMDQQEKIINRQDDDLLHMKNEMRMVVKQKEELDAIVSSNNLEICNLNNQISKLKEEVSRLQILENRAKEVEQREKITEDQMQKTSCEKRSLEDKLEKLEKEKLSYEETIENNLKMSKALKKDLGECEEKLHDAEKQKRTLEKNLLKMTDEQKSLKETIDLVHKEKSLLKEQIHHFETQVKNLTDSKIENENLHKNNQNKISEQLELHNKQLQQEIESLKLDIQSKQKQFDALQESLNETVENTKTVEKELQKQERINKRNREEMENWKKEKDTCVRQLENLISKRHEENSFLAHEIEQLKKDNSDLAKNMNTAISMKDSLIADLKKANNTLSIQLAHSQGTCPPPKMTSPDNSYFKNNELIEDLDTTGHLEIDATPPIAAKKGRKKQLLSEVFLTPVFKSLKTIEEQNESSPSKSSSSRSSQHSSSEQTAEASSLTPITRSAKRQKENKKKKMQEPFNLASYVAADESQNENVNPYSTRRSSRLKTKK